MTPIKNFLNREFYRLTHLRGLSDLPILYFRSFQGVGILIWISFSFSILGGLGLSALGMVLSSLISLAMNLVAAEVGLRASLRDQPMAVGIGLMLAVTHLLSVQFLLSVFGLYACLNPAAQKRYLRFAPSWVKDWLGKFKIDWTR